jgi:succinoglycan biosynthesis protein ExoA
MIEPPTVTIVVPVLNEEAHIDACLAAVDVQTFGEIIEVLVVDGGSSDRTVERAGAHPSVRVLDNPRRIQAAALNIAIAEAKGDVIVRVDGHCVIAPDYVERCVDALASTGAAMVGGAMTPTGVGWKQRGIAAAMSSPVGAGPARFHVGGPPGWVDTVYLGAYRTDVVRLAGGYADVAANEDAELAVRMEGHGGVWFDPSIRSTYTPRAEFTGVARQFFLYGRSRAATLRKHPASLSARQLPAPLLVLALLSPWRRRVVLTYGLLLGAQTAVVARRQGSVAAGFGLAVPLMHLTWGAGFLLGLIRPPAPLRSDGPESRD